MEVVQNLEGESRLRSVQSGWEQARQEQLYVVLLPPFTVTVENARGVNAVPVHDHRFAAIAVDWSMGTCSPSVAQMNTMVQEEKRGSYERKPIPFFHMMQSVVRVHFHETRSADHVMHATFGAPKEGDLAT